MTAAQRHQLKHAVSATDSTALEARRRINEACDLISSAYRLGTLNPRETLTQVRSAIAWGAEQQAEDIREEAMA